MYALPLQPCPRPVGVVSSSFADGLRMCRACAAESTDPRLQRLGGAYEQQQPADRGDRPRHHPAALPLPSRAGTGTRRGRSDRSVHCGGVASAGVDGPRGDGAVSPTPYPPCLPPIPPPPPPPFPYPQAAAPGRSRSGRGRRSRRGRTPPAAAAGRQTLAVPGRCDRDGGMTCRGRSSR